MRSIAFVALLACQHKDPFLTILATLLLRSRITNESGIPNSHHASHEQGPWKAASNTHLPCARRLSFFFAISNKDKQCQYAETCLSHDRLSLTDRIILGRDVEHPCSETEGNLWLDHRDKGFREPRPRLTVEIPSQSSYLDDELVTMLVQYHFEVRLGCSSCQNDTHNASWTRLPLSAG